MVQNRHSYDGRLTGNHSCGLLNGTNTGNLEWGYFSYLKLFWLPYVGKCAWISYDMFTGKWEMYCVLQYEGLLKVTSSCVYFKRCYYLRNGARWKLCYYQCFLWWYALIRHTSTFITLHADFEKTSSRHVASSLELDVHTGTSFKKHCLLRNTNRKS